MVEEFSISKKKDTKACLWRENFKVKVSFIMETETFIEAGSKITKNMEKESLCLLTIIFKLTKVTLLKTNFRVKDKSITRTETLTKVVSEGTKSMVRVFTRR
jgi:hypothetical protein